MLPTRQLALLTVAFVACSKPPSTGGLMVQVHLAMGAHASCVEIEARSLEGTVLGTQRLVEPDPVRDLKLGIGPKGFPTDIDVRVTPLLGAKGCDAPVLPNGPVVARQLRFPSQGVTTETFEIGLPPTDTDGDRDGYVGFAHGGPDCNDNDPTAYPGAAENCMSLGDLDCDGNEGCKDSICTGQPNCAQPADRLVFTTPPRTPAANECSQALDVESRDPADVAATLPASRIITLTTAASGVRFYSDPACATEVTTLSAVAPASRFTFYFKATTAGSVSISASSTGLMTATQVQTVLPPPATLVVFVGGPVIVQAGSCTSAPIELEARDATGQPTPVTVDTSVMLSISPGGTADFFTGTNCTGPTTSVTILSGQTRVSFFARGLMAGSGTITASPTGLTLATQMITVTAGPPSQLAFASAAQGIPIDTCSAAVRVRSADMAGNPTPVAAPVMVDMSATGLSGITFHSDPMCNTATNRVTLPAGAGAEAIFYFRGSSTGTATLRAADSTGTLTAATQTAMLGVGPPNRLGFSTSSYGVGAGACSPIVTVQVRDSMNNPTNPPMPVAVTLMGTADAGFGLFTDPGCTAGLAGPLMISGQPSGDLYFHATRAGPFDLTATATGLTGISQMHTIQPGSPTRLQITTPAQLVSAGSCSGTTRLDVFDTFGNLAPVMSALPIVFTASGTGAGGVTFHANATCSNGPPGSVPSGSSGVDFRFRGTQLGMPTVVATSGAMMASQQETISAGAVAAVVFNTAPHTQVAGGCSQQLLELQARDMNNNPAPAGSGGLSLTLSSTDGGFRYFTQLGCMSPNQTTMVQIPAGQTSAFFAFDATRTGMHAITATGGGFTPSQTQTITPATAAAVRITTPSRTVAANTCSGASNPVTVATEDAFGNTSTVTADATLQVDGGPTVQIYTGATCMGAATPSVIVPNGASSTSFYFRGSTPGTPTITVSGLGSTSQQQTIGSAPTLLTFTTAAQTRYAGECSGTVTVQTRDGAGPVNVGADLTVALTAVPGFTFYTDMGCTAVTTSVVIPAGMSIQSFRFRGIKGGMAMLGATSAGLMPASQAVTIYDAVRKGTCTINSGSTNVNCGIPAPPLMAMDKTFMVFQTEPGNNNPAADDTLAKCALTSTNNVRCERGDNQTGVAINIFWQTATFPTAATVQHFTDVNCTGGSNTTNVTVADVQNMSETFLLHSMDETGTGDVDDNEHVTVTLTGSQNVELRASSGSCSSGEQHDLQVVRLAGAQVVRGTTQFNDGDRIVSASGLTNASGAMVLYSWRNAFTGDDPCERNLRGHIGSGTSLTFERAYGNSSNSCADNGTVNVAFERVVMPPGSGVQEVTIALNSGSTSNSAGITPVDVTRSIVLTGSNTHSGQGLGETQLDNAVSPSHYVARFSLNGAGDTVTATRVTAPDSARYTVYVVQFDPR